MTNASFSNHRLGNTELGHIELEVDGTRAAAWQSADTPGRSVVLNGVEIALVSDVREALRALATHIGVTGVLHVTHTDEDGNVLRRFELA